MHLITVLTTIVGLVYNPKLSRTYFPGEKLKGKLFILRDHLLWLAKYKEVNRFYYIYGLDRKQAQLYSDVLPYRKFMRIRDSKNLKPEGKNFNYTSLLRDKFVFGQFLTSLNFPTPKNIALFENGNITWLDSMKTESIDSLDNCNVSIDGFCKKLTGLMGDGAFPLELKDGKIYCGSQLLSPEQLKTKMKGEYLWQRKIQQHEQMGSLHPQSVNTIRLITFNVNGKIDIFSATLRIGTNGRRVDNWNAGGIAVGIDLKTGTARKKGIYKPGYGTGVEVHPDSGVTLGGFPIPFFKEATELTKKLHSCFYGIHSIGWDIAITPNGPVFVEGNDDWDGSMPMSLEENFKTRFLKMYSMYLAAVLNLLL
jgi:hypothetical protein